jgi:L-aspartate oxidase
LMTQTSIPGVYAVGETTSTGVHGANRLASNSLLECVVFGAQLNQISILFERGSANDAKLSIESPTTASSGLDNWVEKLAENPEDWIERVQSIRQELPRLMWQAAGICREQNSLETAIDRVKVLQVEFDNLPISQLISQLAPSQSGTLPAGISQSDLCTWGETHNLLEIGSLILTSALMRTESRGGHYRTDFPALDPNWQVHTIVTGDRWSKSDSIE